MQVNILGYLLINFPIVMRSINLIARVFVNFECQNTEKNCIRYQNNIAIYTKNSILGYTEYRLWIQTSTLDTPIVQRRRKINLTYFSH